MEGTEYFSKTSGFRKKKPDGYHECNVCGGTGSVSMDRMIPKNSDMDSFEWYKSTENCPNDDCFNGYVQDKDD